MNSRNILKRTITFLGFFFIFCFLITISVIAQGSNEKRASYDSTLWITVEEYDTIFEPDTVTVIDTILKYIPKKHNWTVGISMCPYFPVSSNENEGIDSFLFKENGKYNITLNVRYSLKKYFINTSIGLSMLQNRFQYTLNSLVTQSNANSVDTIYFQQNCSSTNNFTYLNLNLQVLRNLTWNNYYCALGVNFISAILLSKEVPLPASNDEIKYLNNKYLGSTQYYLALNLNLGYIINKKYIFYIAPDYVYNINPQGKFQYFNRSHFGLGIGFNLIL